MRAAAPRCSSRMMLLVALMLALVRTGTSAEDKEGWFAARARAPVGPQVPEPDYDAEAKRMLNAMDRDKNGMLDEVEIREFFFTVEPALTLPQNDEQTGQPAGARVIQAFGMLDKDGNKELSMEEVRPLFISTMMGSARSTRTMIAYSRLSCMLNSNQLGRQRTPARAPHATEPCLRATQGAVREPEGGALRWWHGQPPRKRSPAGSRGCDASHLWGIVLAFPAALS